MHSNGLRKDEPILSSMWFLEKNHIYEVEKPYAFRYPVNSVAQTNMKMRKYDDILITDIRGREADFSFEKDGFTIVRLDRRFEYDWFWDEKTVQPYFRALEELLKKDLGADEVYVFRYGLRKRDPGFPISTGEKYEYDQPTSVAHVGNCKLHQPLISETLGLD
jgi:hypothetical protein